MQLRLGDLALGFRGLGDELAAGALELRFVALERRQPIKLHQILRIKIADAFQFLLDQRDFLVLGVLLRGQADDLLLQLGDALLQLFLLAGAVFPPQVEQLALAGHRLGDVGIVEMVGKLSRHGDRIGAVALGGEPRLAGIKLGEALGDDGQIGLRHRFVELDENLPRLHVIAVMHEQFADHAAGGVLHFLDVGIDDDVARRDQRAGDFRGRGPAAEAERQKTDQHAAGNDVAADRFVGAVRRPGIAEGPAQPGHRDADRLAKRCDQPGQTDIDATATLSGAAHPAPPCSATFSRGGVFGGVRRVRISSFGPNCCWRPLPMMRI